MSTLFQARAKLSWSDAEALVPDGGWMGGMYHIAGEAAPSCDSNGTIKTVPFNKAVRMAISISC